MKKLIKKIKDNELFCFLFQLLLTTIGIVILILLSDINSTLAGYLLFLAFICMICWSCRSEEFSNYLKAFINSSKQILPIFLGIALLAYFLYSISGMKNFCSHINTLSYVYAFPNKDYAKNYRVIAELNYGSDYGYQISKIYFANGGYIEFNFCENGNNKGELFYCEANNDEKEWHFRYYGEKVKNNKELDKMIFETVKK